MHENNNDSQNFNFHTHTCLCKHATGETSDYVREAVRKGVKMLGFTEHPPVKPEGIWTKYKLDEKDLDIYFDSINKAREDFPEISLLAGLELDLYPEFKSYYDNEIFDRYRIDYMIGGVHWLKYRGEWLEPGFWTGPEHLAEYFKEMLGRMESGLITFAAHPDSYMQGYLKWDENAASCARDILSAAEEYRIPLEINGYGLRKPMIETPDGPRRKYPHIRFWEAAAEYDITVVCNSDAHRPEDVVSSIDEGREIARRFNLEFYPVQKILSDTFSDKTALSL